LACQGFAQVAPLAEPISSIPDFVRKWSRGRFVREAEITGGLEHPGIVPVYALGKYADGRPFYAMRFIKRETLKDAIGPYHQTSSNHSGARSQEFELRVVDALRSLLRLQGTSAQTGCSAHRCNLWSWFSSVRILSPSDRSV
jgi:hypothetical protein